MQHLVLVSIWFCNLDTLEILVNEHIPYSLLRFFGTNIVLTEIADFVTLFDPFYLARKSMSLIPSQVTCHSAWILGEET